jgi:hypothetical protein
MNGTCLIQQLKAYRSKGGFKSSTLFCSFDIRNLFTMLPQDEALKILSEFLQHYGYTKVNGIDLTTIQQLARVVLEENAFVYKNKIYRQILGGAMGSSFTLTLANVFLWKWQQKLVDLLEEAGEFFGR